MKPMQIFLRRPLRYSHPGVHPQADPLFIEIPIPEESRHCSPTSVKEVEQRRHVIANSKMADDSDTFKVEATPNPKVAAASNKSTTNRYSHPGVLPQIDPLFIQIPIPVESRPCSPTSIKEVEQPRHVTPKIADDSDTFKVEATPNPKGAAASNKSTTNRFEFVPPDQTLHASKLNKEGPKRSVKASNKSLPVASGNAPKRRRISSSLSLVETAGNIRISPPPVHFETPRPKLENLKLPAYKKSTENRPATAETRKKREPTGEITKKQPNSSSTKAPKQTEGIPLPAKEVSKKSTENLPATAEARKKLEPPGEITKKRPNSSSTKAPKQMEGIPLPAKEAPKEKSKDNINRSDMKPKQKAEDAKKSQNLTSKGTSTRHTPSQKNEQASKKGSSPAPVDEVPESPSMDMFGPSGTDNYFIQQHHNFYKHWKDYNVEIGKRLLNLDVNKTQHCCENVTLKNLLDIQVSKIEYFKERLSHQNQLNKELREKYMGAEKHYETQLQIGKSIMGKQKEELASQKSEIVHLKLELSNMQKTNQDMTSVLSRLQMELKQFQDSNTELLDQNSNQMAALQEPKLNMVDEMGLYEIEISQLDAELKEGNIDCSALSHDTVKFQEQQFLPDETSMQLEFSRNEGNSMITFLDDNERINISLSDRIKELEAAQSTLIEINEDFARELDSEKAKASMERKALKDAYEVVILSLTSTSCQPLLDLKELSKSYEDLKAENLLQRSLHEQKLNECEMQRLELEEANKSLQNELQVQTQIFQAELAEKQKQKQVETNRIQALKSNFEGEKERYEHKICALEAAVEQSDRESKDEQEKLLSHVARNYELERSFFNLQDEKEKIANELSAAKIKFNEVLKCQADAVKNKLCELQAALKGMENESEKNELIIDNPLDKSKRGNVA